MFTHEKIQSTLITKHRAQNPLLTLMPRIEDPQLTSATLPLFHPIKSLKNDTNILQFTLIFLHKFTHNRMQCWSTFGCQFEVSFESLSSIQGTRVCSVISREEANVSLPKCPRCENLLLSGAK